MTEAIDKDAIAAELLERAERYAENKGIEVEEVDWDEVRDDADDDHRFRQWRDQ